MRISCLFLANIKPSSFSLLNCCLLLSCSSFLTFSPSFFFLPLPLFFPLLTPAASLVFCLALRLPLHISAPFPSLPYMALSVLGAWTVSSPAEPADVYGADAAGCYHGAEVPIQLSCDPRSGQHPARSNVTCHHHCHRQPPLCRQQVARPGRWEICVHYLHEFTSLSFFSI